MNYLDKLFKQVVLHTRVYHKFIIYILYFIQILYFSLNYIKYSIYI